MILAWLCCFNVLFSKILPLNEKKMIIADITWLHFVQLYFYVFKCTLCLHLKQ